MEAKHYMSAEALCGKTYFNYFRDILEVKQMPREVVIDFYIQAHMLFLDLKPNVMKYFDNSEYKKENEQMFYYDMALSSLCDQKALIFYKKFHELTKNEPKEKIEEYLERNKKLFYNL